MSKKNLGSKTQLKIKDVKDAYQDYESDKDASNNRKAASTGVVMILILIAFIAAISSKYSSGEDCDKDEPIVDLDCSLNKWAFNICVTGPLILSGLIMFNTFLKSVLHEPFSPSKET